MVNPDSSPRSGSAESASAQSGFAAGAVDTWHQQGVQDPWQNAQHIPLPPDVASDTSVDPWTNYSVVSSSNPGDRFADPGRVSAPISPTQPFVPQGSADGIPFTQPASLQRGFSLLGSGAQFSDTYYRGNDRPTTGFRSGVADEAGQSSLSGVAATTGLMQPPHGFFQPPSIAQMPPGLTMANLIQHRPPHQQRQPTFRRMTSDASAHDCLSRN